MYNNRNRLLQQQQRQQQAEQQRKQAKADRVRKLWVEFDQWLRQPRSAMERERDMLMQQSGRISSTAVMATRRRIEGGHFHEAREEWQRRLKAAGLDGSDWEPMTEAEMKAVEEALGVDDEEGYIIDPSPSPPHQVPHALTITENFAPTEIPGNSSTTPLINGNNEGFSGTPSSFTAAPPLTTASRTSSMSSTYECVRPEEFHSEDDELTSDSDYSSFSSTISTMITEEDESVGPVTEYMFSQALESSGFPGNHANSNATRSAPIPFRQVNGQKFGSNNTGGTLLAPSKRPSEVVQPQPVLANTHSSNLLRRSPEDHSEAPSTSTASTSKSNTSKPARVHYPLITPYMSDLSDHDDADNDGDSDPLAPSLVAQFEAQFEAKKLEIRINKINEFHQYACDADVNLCVTIANGRRTRTFTRQEENRLVNEHYQQMVSLRERMEKERKEDVSREKKRLRDEFRQRSANSSSTQPGRSAPGPTHFGLDSQGDLMSQEDEIKKKLDKVRQEQLAMQAKFSAQEPPKSALSRGRARTITAETAPSVSDNRMNGVGTSRKKFDGPEISSNPSPITKVAGNGAWSLKSNNNLGNASARVNIDALGGNDSRSQPNLNMPGSLFDYDGGTMESELLQDDEKENDIAWSHPSNTKKKASNPPLHSAWNLASKAQQKSASKSKLDIVTSAWDEPAYENTNDTREVEPEVQVQKESETPTQPAVASPPSAPATTASKKQTKKQRQASKKGTAAPAAKVEKVEVTPPASTPSAQKASTQQNKSVPVPVSTKSEPNSKRKPSISDADEISSTPRPSALKRVQAQATLDDEDEDTEVAPPTPRPGAAAKRPMAQSTASAWGRGLGKGISGFAGGFGLNDNTNDEMGVTPGATSSRTTLDQPNGMRGNKNTLRGSEFWQPVNNQEDQVWNTSKASANGGRKNASSNVNTSAPVNGNGKGKGKKAMAHAQGFGKVPVQLEEVPDEEDSFTPDKDTLPYNSRSVLELMTNEEPPPPKILEPKPSKPRTMFEQIIQYGEEGPGSAVMAWDDEKMKAAMENFAKENEAMQRKLNGHPASAAHNEINFNPTSNLRGGQNGAEPKTTKPKQVHWTPSTLSMNNTAKSQNPINRLQARVYDDDAFSPVSMGATSNTFNAGWPPAMGSATGSNRMRDPFDFDDGEPDQDDELMRAARSMLDNINLSVSSKTRNRPVHGVV
ncbi:hypothetical protein AMATHDRAFT_6277 [Amanita thiersii Skay4041]|uniref:Uncharacterized protein n=1 Tax=Amanita thiersii Skay4041 TaxID=703135 RepID=A0A2A9NI10_9AGAR|nr:hypothetical protein AMATHDRAFT_6277 [Amanita thiersii Skay4041]